MQTPPIRAVDAVLNSGVSQAPNNEGWLPTDRATLQLDGFENVFVMGDTVDLPISKAGGSCHNQAPVICANIAGLMRIGQTVAAYDGCVLVCGARPGLNRRSESMSKELSDTMWPRSAHSMILSKARLK